MFFEPTEPISLQDIVLRQFNKYPKCHEQPQGAVKALILYLLENTHDAKSALDTLWVLSVEMQRSYDHPDSILTKVKFADVLRDIRQNCYDVYSACYDLQGQASDFILTIAHNMGHLKSHQDEEMATQQRASLEFSKLLEITAQETAICKTYAKI